MVSFKKEKKMNLAVIPARGGSKRIKKKNIKLFNKQPIILFTIKKLLDSNLFDRIIVSTDSNEIIDICKNYKVEIIIRPKELSDDYTSTNEVVKHALEINHNNIELDDLICCVYPTAPFLRISDLHRSRDIFDEDKDFDNPVLFSFPVTEYKYPIQRALNVNEKGFVKTFWNGEFPKYSQNLEKSFHDVGQFYWGRARSFIDNISMFNGSAKIIQIPGYLSHDIDNEDDWIRAELYYEFLNKKKLI